MSRWEDVLHQQHLLWRFWVSEAGRRYQDLFLKDALRKDQNLKAEHFSTMQANQAALMFNADPIFVDGEVQTVVTVAAEQIEPEPFLPQDLITQVGFMVFPRPLYVLDALGKRCAIRAFGWQPALSGQVMDDDGFARVSRASWQSLQLGDLDQEEWHGAGIELAMYSHDDDTDDYFSEEDRRLNDGKGLGATLLPGMHLTLFHVTPIRFGRSFEASLGGMSDELHRQGGREVWRYFQTAQRIARQRITTHTERPLPRQMRRQLARAGEPRTDVTVITLRRPSHVSEEERAVEWSCRWLVRGHWRNQFFATENLHRQIWISGYLKGPPDA